jgi:hypothetical protein
MSAHHNNAYWDGVLRYHEPEHTSHLLDFFHYFLCLVDAFTASVAFFGYGFGLAYKRPWISTFEAGPGRITLELSTEPHGYEWAGISGFTFISRSLF